LIAAADQLLTTSDDACKECIQFFQDQTPNFLSAIAEKKQKA
jgi:hypothetical protein